MEIIKDWMVFRFRKNDDEIAEFFRLNGARPGRAPYTYGVPLKNQQLILRAYETFNFSPTPEAESRVRQMLATRALIYDGRKVEYNEATRQLHILARKVNSSLRKLMESLDGYRALDAEESVCDITSFNAALITKMQREYGFSCSPSAVNSFLDLLSPTDKLVNLKLAHDIKEPRVYLRPEYKLLSHQIIGVHALLSFEKFAIFDEMGLGKTLQMIAAATNFIEHGICRAGIIVCPASLTYTWDASISDSSYLRSQVIYRGMTVKKRREVYERLKLPRTDPNALDLVIMSYGIARNDRSHLAKLGEEVRAFLSLDESQNIKNPDAKTTRALLEIAPYYARRYIFTGTPIASTPADIWPQWAFINGINDLRDYYRFRNRYIIFKEIKTKIPGTNKKRKIKIPVARKNMVELRGIIDATSLRRKKEDVLDLPEKVYQTRYIELTGEQHRLYKEMNEQHRAELSALPEDTISAKNELTKLLRLVQIASNPGLIFDNYRDVPAKVLELDTIVDEQLESVSNILDSDSDEVDVANNKKIVIFTSYLDNIKMLADRYSKYNPVIIQGEGMSSLEKKRSEDEFQNNPKCRMLIGQTSAAQAGFTLTASDMIVYMDRGFSLLEWLQSQDRIHRIGQTGTCTIVSFIAKGTIDEYIASVVDGKKDLAVFLQGDKSQAANDVAISRKDILEAMAAFV